MPVNRSRVKRGIASAFVGLLVGFLIALVISGFRVGDALVALLWCLPFILGLAYVITREKRDSP
jgi:hypothetical protein